MAQILGTAPARTPLEPPFTLTLLDGFELRDRGLPIALPPVCQRVVAFLALSGRPLTRVYVAGALWLHASEEHSCASLRSALWRIRSRRDGLIEATVTHVALSGRVAVDVHGAVIAMRGLLSSDAASREELDATYSTGELLPDWYDDWLDPERERLRQLRLHALEAAAGRLLSTGRTPHAIDVLLAEARQEPLRDSLHRLLVEAHLAEGNATEAIHCYERYRERLTAALGIPPSPQMEAVVGGLGVAVTRR